jgi:beta-phosphoglucomutase
MPIKAILFDMDGVLIDARDWHYEALNESLAHFGYTISRESHLSTFDGLPTKKKLNILSQSLGLPVGLHALINSLKQKYTIQYSYNHCRPQFNHRQALSKLSNQYKIAVCSNSIRATIDTMMELSKLSPFIDLIVSNQDVSHSKPHPEMYLNAMHKLQLQPDECLIVEDNEHGIQAALASGGHLLRVANPVDVTLKRIELRIAEIGT